MLVDDDHATNFANKIIIDRAGVTENTITASNGIEALDYLNQSSKAEHPSPDLILLDINMPGMNGWEFLDEYNKLSPTNQAEVVVVMLTSSMSPLDKEKAKEYGVSNFRSKPLTIEMVEEIVNENFGA